MDNIVNTLGSALLLEDRAYVGLRDARNNFVRGLTIIIVISLIVGLFSSLASFISAMRTTPAEEVAQVRADIEQAIDQMRALGAFSDEAFMEGFMPNFKAGFDIAEEVARIVQKTTPLPDPVVDFFQALGQWLSYPFGWISTWMLYGLLVLVIAKLLGGTSTIQEMLATTSLVALPHLLDAFRFLPIIGSLLGIVAFFWGLAVYVKATAVANRFTAGKALLAVIAPGLILVVLLVIVFIGLLLVIIISHVGR